MPGAEVAKQAGARRWPLLFLLRSRPGHYRGETDVPFVTACFVDLFVRTPHAVRQRPCLAERLRVRNSQPIIDCVFVDARDAFDGRTPAEPTISGARAADTIDRG
jgi:hypothetical protein